MTPIQKKLKGPFATSVAIHLTLLGVIAVMIWLGPQAMHRPPRTFLSSIENTPELLEESAQEPAEAGPEMPAESAMAAEAVQAEEAPALAPEVLQMESAGWAPAPFSAHVGSGLAPTGADSDGKGMGSLFGMGAGAGTGDGIGSGAGRPVRASVRGMNLEASKLGVVLDVSGSMTPYLEDVTKQIRRQFPQYELFLVEGCCVAWFSKTDEQFAGIQISHGGRLEFEKVAGKHLPEGGYGTIDKAGTANVVAAIQYLVKEKGCDAIYFLSDFRDVVNEEGLKHLQSVLKGRRLYLDSVAGMPEENLGKLAVRSGGGVRRE